MNITKACKFMLIRQTSPTVYQQTNRPPSDPGYGIPFTMQVNRGSGTWYLFSTSSQMVSSEKGEMKKTRRAVLRIKHE